MGNFRGQRRLHVTITQTNFVGNDWNHVENVLLWRDENIACRCKWNQASFYLVSHLSLSQLSGLKVVFSLLCCLKAKAAVSTLQLPLSQNCDNVAKLRKAEEEVVFLQRTQCIHSFHDFCLILSQWRQLYLEPISLLFRNLDIKIEHFPEKNLAFEIRSD